MNTLYKIGDTIIYCGEDTWRLGIVTRLWDQALTISWSTDIYMNFRWTPRFDDHDFWARTARVCS